MNIKIQKTLIILAVAALALSTGCPNSAELNSPQNSENGILTINMGDPNETRTILPKNANIQCNYFSLVLTALGKRVERDWSGSTVSIELSPGSWDLTLIGYSDANRQNIMVNGSVNGIVVSSGQTTSTTVQLQPVMVFNQTGYFIWNINYPADVTSASMVITPLNTSNGSPQQTINFTGGDSKNNSSSPLTLNTGYYKVTFSMTGGERPIGRVDYMHIYENLESYFSYDFIYGLQHSNSIEMVLINPGTYTRGSNNSDDYGASPPHQVTLTKGFYMGKYEVTQEQYQAVTGVNPSSFSSSPASGEVQQRRPVEQVTWYDAVEFCNKLSEQEGLTPAYTITGRSPSSGYPIIGATVTINWNANGYRLPTEAEWEHSCRAGTTTAYNTGETITDNTGWNSNNSGSRTHEVGLKSTNAWGLYDMHGNVMEWCWDWYGSYGSAAQTDPRGATSGAYRVVRGGSWNYYEQALRSASRIDYSPNYGSSALGFRVVRP
ncbi:MAG: formylglycine-generating enzyme family protein [Treponema sp.]|nr:formylglycine-generating enzyme family protein [Treponema sp.]